eukprot:TRINITY_DN3471_c0_g1_i1.p1 TRINITY_DN3471_c0_g1~~TRINITY_DN3471_c0_g1_i1.p1  ORF type:complete len:544 (-),score=58.12 TRINITY_DN3471_c0_g1_i1:20-1492(-)
MALRGPLGVLSHLVLTLSLLLVCISSGGQSAADASENWLDALKPPDWTVTTDFRGISSASLYSHNRFFACFLVLRNVCHTNYAAEYDAYQSGAWYSTLGHNLSKIVDNHKVCRIVKPEYHFPSISDLALRRGMLKSKEEFEQYIVEEERKYNVKPKNKWDGSTEKRPHGIIALHDPFPGHMVRDWGPLADFQHSIWESIGRPVGYDVLYGNNLTYYLPGLPPNRFPQLSRRVLSSIFGPKTHFMIGKGRKNYRHVCFEEAVFPMHNSKYLEPSEAMQNFKKRLYASVKPSQALPAPSYQITWLWRSSRRKLINSAEMFDFLVDAFRDFPVQGMLLPIRVVEVNDNMAFEEVLRMMRQTAFAIGMHGAAMFQETFMPVGSHMLELLPYKGSKTHFQDIGTSLGIKHEVWLNTHFESTVYDNDCFTNSSWHALSDFDCVRIKACFACTKDHPDTYVNIAEIRPIIESIKPTIKEWILKQQPELASLEIAESD